MRFLPVSPYLYFRYALRSWEICPKRGEFPSFFLEEDEILWYTDAYGWHERGTVCCRAIVVVLALANWSLYYALYSAGAFLDCSPDYTGWSVFISPYSRR
jgi:hypothetical protein